MCPEEWPVGAASRPRKAGRLLPRQIQLPARYSPGYPVKNGHNHLVRSIPVEIWEAARKRAHAEERAMRNVVIVAPELYAAGA